MSADTTPGLAQCPFCGGAMRVQSNRDWHRLLGDHDDDCVWGQDDDAVMMVPAQPDQLAAMVHAWNRRSPAPAPPQYPPMPEHWAVVASVNGQDILCISENSLAGSGELSEAEEQAVIGMAQHLLAFVGYGMPQCDFDPDDTAPAQGPSMDDLTELVRSLGHNTWRQSAEIASAVLARWGAPAASGEPVAWLIQLSPGTLGGQELTTLRDRAKLARHLGYSVTDLYAKPAQS